MVKYEFFENKHGDLVLAYFSGENAYYVKINNIKQCMFLCFKTVYKDYFLDNFTPVPYPITQHLEQQEEEPTPSSCEAPDATAIKDKMISVLNCLYETSGNLDKDIYDDFYYEVNILCRAALDAVQEASDLYSADQKRIYTAKAKQLTENTVSTLQYLYCSQNRIYDDSYWKLLSNFLTLHHMADAKSVGECNCEASK